jgi:polar amino acid transport system substrate-binding protein
MSRRLRSLAVCLGIAALVAACGQEPRGDPLQRIRARGELIVAHEAAFEPFEYSDPKTGEVVGFDVDLARELAKELGVKVTFRNMKFNDVFTDVRTGRSDLAISGITVTAERERDFAFSTPYFHTVTALLVSRRKAPEVRSVRDLDREGRVVAVQSGTTGVVAAAKACPHAKAQHYDTENDAVLDVVQGRVDAFLYDLASLRKDHEHNPDTTILLPEPITSEPYAVLAHKDEPALVAWVSAVLAKLRASGRLQEILARHKPDGTLDAAK